MLGYDLAGFINANGTFPAEISLSDRSQFRLKGQLDSADNQISCMLLKFIFVRGTGK